MSDPLRIVVTGATGFVGHALAKRLAADPSVSLSIAGRRLERAQDLLDAGATPLPFDLSDPTTFPGVVANQDVVIHCAAWVGRSDSEHADALNIEGSRRLADAAAGANVGRFVLISSVASYGLPPTDHVTEDSPLDTTQADAYGRTKALGELATIEACSAAGLPWVAVRPGMVYGPGSPGWTLKMVRSVQRRVPVIVGDGGGYGFPVYIDNLVDLIVLAARHPSAENRAYHVSDGPCTWNEWFGHYSRMSGVPLRRVPLFAARLLVALGSVLPLNLPLDAHRLKYVTRHIDFDTTRARTELGWTPKVSLEEGMAAGEAWLKEQGVL